MHLSDVSRDLDVSLISDGIFEELSLLGRARYSALVPVYDVQFIGRALEDEAISCIITTPEIFQSTQIRKACLVSHNPLDTFLDIHKKLLDSTFYRKGNKTYVADTAQVHPTAYIEKEDVFIGEGCVVGANAVILSGTEIDQNTVIGPNTTIGYDGFEVRTHKGVLQCIPHGGGVVIGSNVDVQANSSIARSVFNAPTVIDNGCKLGHQVFVSHGVTLGEKCRLGAQAVISGSCKVGKQSWIGPSATISNGVRIGEGSFISIGAVVVSDVQDGERVSGNFAIDHKKFLRKMIS